MKADRPPLSPFTAQVALTGESLVSALAYASTKQRPGP